MHTPHDGCRHVGLVLCWVRLGPAHVLACATGRDRCRHGWAWVQTKSDIGAVQIHMHLKHPFKKTIPKIFIVGVL